MKPKPLFQGVSWVTLRCSLQMVLPAWSKLQGSRTSDHRALAPCPTPLELLRAPGTYPLLTFSVHLFNWISPVEWFLALVKLLSFFKSLRLPITLTTYNPPAPKSGKFLPPWYVSHLFCSSHSLLIHRPRSGVAYWGGFSYKNGYFCFWFLSMFIPPWHNCQNEFTKAHLCCDTTLEPSVSIDLD